MAGASLLTLLDDITTVLDDVSVMTKVAAKKTAGVLGDDLALNAQQVAGVTANRELPVVWAVAKGSARNKLILVPAALAISALMPWAIVPLLMLGGAFLCYEGFEKIAHKLLHSPGEDAEHHADHVRALSDPAVDMVTYEREKVKGAVRTDFILSAEIVTITLGTVADVPFATQVAVLAGIAAIMTVGVYGFVAAIVKLDDAGFYLNRRDNAVLRGIGRGLVAAAPYLMKTLSVAGTAAMFLVGGGILTHGVPVLHHAIEQGAESLATLPAAGTILSALAPSLLNLLAGVVAGAAALLGVNLMQRLRGGHGAAGGG